MNITVIGCGRWGSLITWYLDSIGHTVTLCGRAGSERMQRFLRERRNDLLELPPSVALSTDMEASLQTAETVILSVSSQALRQLCGELAQYKAIGKTFVLCMKGLEVETGQRLSEIAGETGVPNRAFFQLFGWDRGMCRNFTAAYPTAW